MSKGVGQFLRVGVCALGLAACGCATTRDLRVELEDRRPAARVHAVTLIVQQARVDLVPALVDRLDDADPAVRLYTIVGLEKLTGTRLGYDYSADSSARREAIDRWRAHVASPKRAETAEGAQLPRGAAP